MPGGLRTRTRGGVREDQAPWGPPTRRFARRGSPPADTPQGETLLGADEHRSARLLFADELAAGTVTPGDLERPEVARAVASRPVPPKPVRYLQRLAMKRGAFSFARHNVGPFVGARRAVLGPEAGGPPRFLVRVDEYPLAGAYEESRRAQEDFERFHAILTEAGVPYLMAVNAAVAEDYLDPSAATTRPLSDREVGTLERVRDDGVALAFHGLDHRTRDARPRHHSELGGLSRDALRARLDRGHARLDALAIHPSVFVAPFNRFAPEHYDVLAERYEIVCGGPETVPLLGFHRTPLWRGEALYLPSYAPLYGRAETMLPAVSELVAAQPAVWLPIVLHWSWEARDGWEPLERLARALAPYARAWDAVPGVTS